MKKIENDREREIEVQQVKLRAREALRKCKTRII